MKVAVYNRGLLSEKLIQRMMDRYDQLEVICMFDIEDNNNGFDKNKRLEDLREYAKQNFIDAVVIPDLDKNVNKVLEHLYSLENLPLYYAGLNTIRKDKDFHLKLIDRSKPWLSVMEYHVADTCNMNCKGCGHCANLISDPGFPDPGEYEKELERLAVLFDGVGLIRLMGGEPLLNPDLAKYIRLTRCYFPYSNLHIVTNGILLFDMPAELKQVIRDENVIVDVSLYPPMHGQENNIRSYLKSQNIMFEIEKITSFYRRFTPRGGNDAENSFLHCNSAENHLMYKGKIASCAMPFSVSVLNREYGYGIIHDAWIDLFDDNIDGWEINRKLKSASKLCSYCSACLEKFEWEKRSKPDICETDWIYNT